MDIAFGTKLAKFKQMTQLLVYAMSTGPSAYCLGLFLSPTGSPTAYCLVIRFPVFPPISGIYTTRLESTTTLPLADQKRIRFSLRRCPGGNKFTTHLSNRNTGNIQNNFGCHVSRLQICPLYILGNNPPQMVPTDRHIGFHGFGFDSGPNLQLCVCIEERKISQLQCLKQWHHDVCGHHALFNLRCW